MVLSQREQPAMQDRKASVDSVAPVRLQRASRQVS
jgi:hypothetical protein